MAENRKDGVERRATFTLYLPPTTDRYAKAASLGVVNLGVQQRAIQHLDRQLWVITKAYGDNYYDIQKGSSLVLDFDYTTGKLDTSGGYTNDNTTSHTRVWNATGIKLEVGDTCRISYRGHDYSQKPFILSAVRMPFGQQTTSDEVENFEPIPITAHTWAQHQGYWFLPGHSTATQRPFGLQDPEAIEVFNETLVWEQVGPDVNIHFHHRAVFTLDFEIRVNGSPVWTGPPGPSGVGWGTSGPRPDLGIPEDHTFLVVFATTYTTEDVTADYSYYNSGSGDTKAFLYPQVYVEGGGDALATTIQFRGVSLFPEESNQIVAVLSGSYTDSGDLYRVDNADNEIITISSPGIFFNTAHVPNALPTLNSATPPPPELQGGPSQIVQFSPGTYSLSLRTYYSGLVFYLTKDVYANNTEYYTGDGSRTEFILGGGPASYYTPDGYVDGPALVIDSVNSVTVNGDPVDYNVVGFDKIALDVPPASGDFIAIDVMAYTFVAQQLDFLSSGIRQFTLTQPRPIEIQYMELNSVNRTNFLYFQESTGTIFFRQYLSPGNTVNVSYQYNTPIGSTYDVTGVRVMEKNVQTNEVVVLTTNTPAYPANPETSEGRKRSYYPTYLSTRGAGQLFFDVVKNSYTIAGPTGLIWRSRTPLEEPAPFQATPRVHYTLTPWTNDGYSTDKYITQNLSLTEFPRRQLPWLGFSAAGPYGLQGSWGRVGGFRGDSDFFIRFWKRHPTTFVWKEIAARSVTTLCGDRDPEYPVRVCPAGVVGIEHRIPSGQGLNTTWPALRDYEGWVVAASWIVHNYENDFADNPTNDPYVFGWRDAGLTINVLSTLTGNIKASITYRCDKEMVIDLYENSRYNVEKAVDDSETLNLSIIDKYENNNPIYWPPLSGTTSNPPYMGQISWAAAEDFFADPPTSSTWFMNKWLKDLKIDNSATLQYPGAPSLQGQHGEPIGWISNSTEENRPENSCQPCAIRVDENNDMYMTICVPTWCRLQDRLDTKPNQQPTVLVPRTTTYNFVGFTSTNPSFFVNISLGGLAANVTGTFAYGGPFPIFHPSIYTGIASLYNVLRFYPTSTFVGTNEFGDSLFEYASTTVTITWNEWRIAPGATAVTTHGVARCAEFPTFLGFQCSPMPYSGFKMLEYESDTLRQYIGTFNRFFLVKLHYEKNTLTEVWKKEITEYGTPRTAPSVPVLNQNVPTDTLRVPHTLAVGRFVFVLKIGSRDNLTAVAPPTPTTSTYLEAYLNGDTAPLTYKFRIDIGDHYSISDVMTADVDETGREHVTVVSNTMTTVVWFDLDLEVVPTITQRAVGPVSGEPVMPQTAADADRLARGSSNYYWDVTNTNDIKRRESL